MLIVQQSHIVQARSEDYIIVYLFFLISWYKGSILSENSAVACDGVYYDVDENWHENGEQIDYQDYYYDENPMKQIWFDWHYYVYHFDVMVT